MNGLTPAPTSLVRTRQPRAPLDLDEDPFKGHRSVFHRMARGSANPSRTERLPELSNEAINAKTKNAPTSQEFQRPVDLLHGVILVVAFGQSLLATSLLTCNTKTMGF